ncbi:MAG: HAMP domain-containing protein [Candidatus Yonathbacteria bacterium]|nr:HAMP domain-containing protein [Candidatus Yonathbacteria bacterium]
MSLRTKISLFFGAIVISLSVAIFVYVEFSVKPNFKEQTVNNFRVIAEENESTYFTFINGLKTTTINWSSDNYLKDLVEKIVDKNNSPRERETAINDFGSYLREKKMKYDTQVLMVDLLDENGIVVASSRASHRGVNEAEEEDKFGAHYFSKTINANFGEAFVRSMVFEEDEITDPMFHITTRVFSTKTDEQGNFIPLPAVLLVHFIPISSSDVFSIGRVDSSAKEALTSKGFTQSFNTSERYVVNKEHLLITPTRTFSEEDIVKKTYINTEPIDECFKNNKEVAKEYVNYRGASVLGISMCIKDQGLVILSEVETKEAYALLSTLVQKTILGGGITLLTIIFAVFFGSRRSLDDLTRIIDGAKRVSSGEMAVRVNVDSRDEIGYLARTFNSMLDTIGITQNKLESTSVELYQKTLLLEGDVQMHEKQEKFLNDSKRAMQNILEDIWQTKEKLKVESIRLQTTLSSIGDGLILIDGNYKIIMVNPKILDFFAMARADLEGKDLRTVMKLWRNKKDEVPVTLWPTEEMFLTKSVVATDLEDDLYITTKNHETYIPVSLSVAPLISAQISQKDTSPSAPLPISSATAPTGGVIIIRDNTEDREFDNAKSGFISIASHQLRTPLTTIRWYSEMLLDEDAGALSKEQKDFLDEIHNGAERLYQTIDLLLGISRVESGKVKKDKTHIDLTAFTTEIVNELTPLIDEKKLSFSVEPPLGDPVVVFLDSLTLRQVILNLFSNAIRYTNEQGLIKAFWTLDDESSVVYSVKDNGIGIPKSQQSRIFSKFFRAENAIQKVPDGSGLGLAFVKDLVGAWGGEVRFETEEGKGTTFIFTIPRNDNKEENKDKQ